MVLLIISILSQGSEGDEAIEQQDPQNYVMKPQREGRGSCVAT